MKHFLLSAIILSAAMNAMAAEPQLKWEFRAESNLYAPPLVADVCPNPGKETILSDSEVRRLKCVDAQGKLVWEYEGHWTKRLTTSAALSTTARRDKGMLVIGNSDGKVCCVDAETGTELWRREAGGIEWGSVIWADLDGDGRDEVVAGTEDKGIVALNAEGDPLWTYKGKEGEKTINIRCPIAAADVNGDGKQEIFAAGRFGPLCVNGDGTLRWQTLTGDDFLSTVIVGDADTDGTPELYACSRNENAVHCFDARTGQPLWKVSMAAGADSHPSSSLALGDIDQDGKEELLVSDLEGYVYCIGVGGELRWVFPIEKRAHAAPSLGDVDGDGRVDILIAGSDHYLYALDSEGRLAWRFKAGLRIVSPTTMADVDDDGKTEILFCGSDKILRCLTLDGRYDPALMPWPSRRFDAAQSGASLSKRAAAQETVTEIVPLLAFGTFDQGEDAGNKDDYPAQSPLYDLRKNRPRGWHAENASGGSWQLDKDAKCQGEASVKVTGPLTLVTDLVELEQGLRTVMAHVAVKGESEGKALLRWRGLRGVLREDALQAGAVSDGWQTPATQQIVPPQGARWVQFVCVTERGTLWWDDAQIQGTFARPYSLRALVNQAGYEIGAPKRFTAQSNFIAKEALFELIDDKGAPVFSAALQHEGRIKGAYDNDWGFEYWRGDFSCFDAPGTYRIRMTLDRRTDVSWPFEIGAEVLWNKTARPAYRFFYYQRCGIEVPGFHKACHLDDATSPDGKRQYELWGGWHDAGDYNTYDNAPYVLGLLTAYGIGKQAFDAQDEDRNGRSDFLDEILWGGDHTRRMIAPDGSAYGGITSGYGYWAPPELETDNKPNTGDERRINGAETGNDSSLHAASMACIARYVDDKKVWIEAAQRALDRALKNNQRGPLQFRAALDLYLATQDEKWAALAKELFPGPNIDALDAIRLYDSVFHEDHGAQLREQLIPKAEAMLELARNPFGVYTFGPKDKPNFFGTPADGGGWHVGTSSHVLQAASLMATAYQFNPDPRYLAFVYDQFNWILGNNPYDISLMEGVGSAFPPTYHHRYTFSGVPRGAVPGSVVNGITSRAVHDDRPYFDMRGLDIPAFESNEVWLPHNTAYLNALANLQGARAGNR